MIYYGKPNLHIIDYENMKEVFKFDNNGVYKTNDDKIIKFMKENKNFIKCEPSAMPMELPDLEPAADKQIFKCKKCGEELDNKGFLMAHYRKAHKNKEE